jgi:very-short-patch-repair endonuclease
MRQILDELPVGSKVPASGLEARFEEICRNAGIRELERQLDTGGHSWLGRVDYVIRRLKLIIEVDSRLYHTSPLDVANDEARDKAMLAAGWRMVLRVAEEDIWRRPWFVVEQVLAAIHELESSP